jgi:hypothetical protein
MERLTSPTRQRAAYLICNPTTPAFGLWSMSATEITPGTTIQSVTPGAPAARQIDLSLASPVAIPVSSAIEFFAPLPSMPTATATIWGGAEGAIATLDWAFRKTGDMTQTLGNAAMSCSRPRTMRTSPSIFSTATSAI